MMRIGARRAVMGAIRAAGGNGSLHMGRTLRTESKPMQGALRTSMRPHAFTRMVPASIRCYAAEGGKIQIDVPEMTESISEGTIAEWLVEVGEEVEMDQVIALIETDKIAVEVHARDAGVLVERFGAEGDTVLVGDKLAVLDPSATPTVAKKADAGAEAAAAPAPMQQKAAEKPVAPAAPSPVTPVLSSGTTGERRIPVSRMRKRIAERLKEAQNTAAMLTTFNEVDMSALMAMRAEYKDAFQEKHGAKLGFMSAFVRASTVALLDHPMVNSSLDGDDIRVRDVVDISVAVSTEKGLVVPAIRGCETLSFADIEKTIVNLGEAARKGKLTLEDMQGGTFTISNGGVFGSLLSTPILNMPQSAILGMHTIQKRPVVVDDQIVIRPMMYLALTYDHRLLDGREAVQFLGRIKTLVEDPRRLLLDVA